MSEEEIKLLIIGAVVDCDEDSGDKLTAIRWVIQS